MSQAHKQDNKTINLSDQYELEDKNAIDIRESRMASLTETDLLTRVFISFRIHIFE
jgi:hypothetical protein